jgi:hypothetical protein
MINIISQVEVCLRESGVREGPAQARVSKIHRE